MIFYNFKIAWRFLLRTKVFTIVNIIGLALGFAGFVLASLYINHEQSYDSWNPHYKDIYLVGLTNQGKTTDLTSVSLGPAIKAQLPEVVKMARVNSFPYEIPFSSDEDVFFIKHWIGADVSFAEMFGIKTPGFDLDSISGQAVFFRPDVAQKLFPNTSNIQDEWVVMGSKDSGFPLQLSGATAPAPGLSNIEFECIAFVKELGADLPNNESVQTFIQVKAGTNIDELTAHINDIFTNSISKKTENINSSIAKSSIYLDPLKNLHLRPTHGSSTGYKIVIALGALSVIILLLAGINFANLMLVLAQKRAKEIGMKKIFGVTRSKLIIQFFSEVFVQCFIAAGIAVFIVSITINILVKNFQYDLSAFGFNESVLFQLFIAVILTSVVSGLYPAFILSQSESIKIIKGRYQNSHRTQYFRNLLLVFQFVIAFGFISVMIVIHKQMDFIETADRGFNVDQVVYIKNQAILNKATDFITFRNRMKAIPGVESVTVATTVPGGHLPKAYDFQYLDRMFKFDHIGVDFEYFETMGMKVLAGRAFSQEFPTDTINAAVLNEAAVKELGLKDPIGTIIRGCNTEFKVIGVIKDSKTLGFEELINPTIYSINNNCQIPKVEILAKISSGNMQATLAALATQWKSINKLDGDYFIYEFVNQKYATLYAKQEQLQRAFTGFTILIILVALMGLFNMAAYSISIRQKEVGIRKVLGASSQEILFLLNKPFLRIICLSILISTPIAWWLANRWLQDFAYRVDIQWWFFALGAVLSLLIAFITVSIQAVKATYLNPVDVLYEE
ncbi:ABC transporter permease [Albibacterium bauzanense]|uniref:Putative ABC transport system permease protein n=1 Tax=Albibacterium bauzanense TaxID=653929 RepID=A0A4R1M4T6_9SPHI|nr:ABC transporter permease [Albibacterium bauzanense]TCK84709.1 putative ABC transport system permease protein [Albibacterium bauzanense]